MNKIINGIYGIYNQNGNCRTDNIISGIGKKSMPLCRKACKAFVLFIKCNCSHKYTLCVDLFDLHLSICLSVSGLFVISGFSLVLVYDDFFIASLRQAFA